MLKANNLLNMIICEGILVGVLGMFVGTNWKINKQSYTYYEFANIKNKQIKADMQNIFKKKFNKSS